MLKTSEKMVAALDEVKEFVFGDMSTHVVLMNMNERELKAYQSTSRFIEALTELSLEQARLMDEQNEKLDKILKKLEESK